MKHTLRLAFEPFNSIKNGQKDIEMRLYDDKRKNIHIDDEIEFICPSINESLTAKVINLYIFEDFSKLYQYFDKSRLGYADNEVANPKDMEIYYPIEKQKEYKVLAIEIKLIKK